MARTTKELSATAVEKAKAGPKDYRLYDGKGLFLLVTTKGGKWWRFKYTFDGKENTLSFGTYPEISLAEARDKRQEARNKLQNGTDPSEVRKAQKEAQAEQDNTFEVIALEWYNRQVPTWADTHAATVISRLKRDVFPIVGSRAINELKAFDMMQVFRKIEARGKIETAHRIKSICGQVFRYAVSTGRVERDCTSDLKGTLTQVLTKSHAALTDVNDVAPFLRAIDVYKGSFVVKCALQLSALVFLRPGELRHAEWAEIDFDAGEWNIPIERMKLKKRIKEARKGDKHLVPLSTKAVEILKSLLPVTGEGRYVFPGMVSTLKPISDNTLNLAIRRMGYDHDEMTAHGFRAMARTILDEVLEFPVDIIEHQLAHVVKDANGRAYNRTTKLPQRKKMMQRWSDYLEELKQVAKVIPFTKAA